EGAEQVYFHRNIKWAEGLSASLLPRLWSVRRRIPPHEYAVLTARRPSGRTPQRSAAARIGSLRRYGAPGVILGRSARGVMRARCCDRRAVVEVSSPIEPPWRKSKSRESVLPAPR